MMLGKSITEISKLHNLFIKGLGQTSIVTKARKLDPFSFY